MSDIYFSDAEVDEICAGLVQDAAKVRYLRSLGLRVDRKPNGRPLAWRPINQVPQAVQELAPVGDNVVTGLQAWAATRKGRHGPQTQGR